MALVPTQGQQQRALFLDLDLGHLYALQLPLGLSLLIGALTLLLCVSGPWAVYGYMVCCGRHIIRALERLPGAPLLWHCVTPIQRVLWSLLVINVLVFGYLGFLSEPWILTAPTSLALSDATKGLSMLLRTLPGTPAKDALYVGDISLTSTMIPGSTWQLLTNVYNLWCISSSVYVHVFGDAWRFLCFYLAASILAGVCHHVWEHAKGYQTWSTSVEGAVCALMGLMLHVPHYTRRALLVLGPFPHRYVVLGAVLWDSYLVGYGSNRAISFVRLTSYAFGYLYGYMGILPALKKTRRHRLKKQR